MISPRFLDDRSIIHQVVTNFHQSCPGKMELFPRDNSIRDTRSFLFGSLISWFDRLVSWLLWKSLRRIPFVSFCNSAVVYRETKLNTWTEFLESQRKECEERGPWQEEDSFDRWSPDRGSNLLFASIALTNWTPTSPRSQTLLFPSLITPNGYLPTF